MASPMVRMQPISAPMYLHACKTGEEGDDNNAVAWAKDNGVTEGTSKTTFSPNTDCTRAQVVTFLYRWMVK